MWKTEGSGDVRSAVATPNGIRRRKKKKNAKMK